jgi:hypothetical protein
LIRRRNNEGYVTGIYIIRLSKGTQSISYGRGHTEPLAILLRTEETSGSCLDMDTSYYGRGYSWVSSLPYRQMLGYTSNYTTVASFQILSN